MSAPAYIQPHKRFTISLDSNGRGGEALSAESSAQAGAQTPTLCAHCSQVITRETSNSLFVASKALRRFERNRLGGLIRAAGAWRWADGTFMSDEERDEIRERRADDYYQRYAAGGRARAAQAERGMDGRYLKCNSNNSHNSSLSGEQ